MTKSHLSRAEFPVSFTNFTAFWEKESKPVLKNINLNIEKGQLYGMCGGVGSGKTSLFQVILKEMPFYSG